MLNKRGHRYTWNCWCIVRQQLDLKAIESFLFFQVFSNIKTKGLLWLFRIFSQHDGFTLYLQNGLAVVALMWLASTTTTSCCCIRINSKASVNLAVIFKTSDFSYNLEILIKKYNENPLYFE
jgi:hypothetical protein